MNTLRKIRRLHFRDGLSVREISRRTGLSRTAIQNWLSPDDLHTAVVAPLAQERREFVAPLHWFARAPAKLSIGPPVSGNHSLRDVFNTWKACDGIFRLTGTVRRRARAVQTFEDCFPGLLLSDITRSHAQTFKSYLHAVGGTAIWQMNVLNEVKTLLNYAYDKLELIAASPWFKIKIFTQPEAPRHPWTLTELRLLFALPLFTEYKLPARGPSGMDAAYWIPLIGIFSGARLAELCQLQTADILAIDGVWVFDINGNNDFKRLKTVTSVRRIPIHSELIRLGFLDYFNATRRLGYLSLWPAMTFAYESNSRYFSVWFGKLKREKSPDRPLPDFHSFRHTVRTKMHNARIVVRVQDAITGHRPAGSSGTRIYTHVNMADLVEAIESIRYDGLRLPQVYRAVRRITLREWASATFTLPPSDDVLRKWVSKGYIQPRPEKVGKRYGVSPAAAFVRAPLIDHASRSDEEAREWRARLMLATDTLSGEPVASASASGRKRRRPLGSWPYCEPFES